MNATQIYDQILSLSDAQLLAELPTEQRLACTVCGYVSVKPAADFIQTGLGRCQNCRQAQPLAQMTYYVKQRTTNPGQALCSHRHFWTSAYYEQVVREKIHLSPYHPLPDPLSNRHTQPELETFRASHIVQFVGLGKMLDELPPAQENQRRDMELARARVQGILDADGWWRGEVRLLENGQLPHTHYQDPEAAMRWAVEVLTAQRLLTLPTEVGR